MSARSQDRFRIEGVSELWFKSHDVSPGAGAKVYSPAMLVECRLNFRSLRAGLNHSEERNYTAWLPENDLAIDWDSPAVEFTDTSLLVMQPDPDISYRPGRYQTTEREFEQYEAELLDKLVRARRLQVFFNPVFGLFSAPGDPLEDFLAQVAEASLGRVEPELKHLRSKFELQLEQVREAQAIRGARAEGLSLEKLIANKLHFFESENRLADMFSTLAGTVFGTTEPRPETEEHEWETTELREDLSRVEQEASEALRALYDEYLALANEYDVFEIGLQPDNIQVARRALLWIPVCGNDE